VWETSRKALISHYSEIERANFRRLTHTGGGKYQDFEVPLY
jgi:hypothetical protein